MLNLLKRIFPITISNQFYGKKVSLIGFYILSFLFLIRGFYYLSITNLESMLSNQPPLAATFLNQLGITELIVTLLNIWGWSQILLSLVFVCSVFRYKAFVPMMYIMMLIDTIIRLSINIMPSQGSQNNDMLLINSGLMIVIPILFILSVIPSKKSLSR
jgi:hypothetical protein